MRDGAQSIHRALAILRTLATSRETGTGLSAIVETTGLSPPTVHRILHALIEEGVVERKPRTGRYALGSEIHLLALARTVQSKMLTVAAPYLQELASDIGDTVFLTLRSGLDTICIARRLGSYPIQVLVLSVGDRRPLGISSAGHALMAAMPHAEARRVLLENGSRIRASELKPQEAREAVRLARARGYALRERGIVPGTKAISVVMSDENKAPNAALTVAGIARRLPLTHIADVVARLKQCAGQIEARYVSKSAG